MSIGLVVVEMWYFLFGGSVGVKVGVRACQTLAHMAAPGSRFAIAGGRRYCDQYCSVGWSGVKFMVCSSQLASDSKTIT